MAHASPLITICSQADRAAALARLLKHTVLASPNSILGRPHLSPLKEAHPEVDRHRGYANGVDGPAGLAAWAEGPSLAAQSKWGAAGGAGFVPSPGTQRMASALPPFDARQTALLQKRKDLVEAVQQVC